MAKLLKPLAVAGLMVASMTTLAAQPPKLKMTTDIPASITAPAKVDTSIGTLNFLTASRAETPSQPCTTISTARGR